MQTPITEEQAKAIGEWYVKSRNEADLSLLDKIVSPDVIVHDPSRPEGIAGLSALKDQYGATHAAVPDVKFTLDDSDIKGDKIVWIVQLIMAPCCSLSARLSTYGTHQFTLLFLTCVSARSNISAST